MGYKAEEIERKFRSVASVRIWSKKSEHAGDAGYWTGGRCDYGGAHNLKEDCQLLAKFFDKITELKNAKSRIIKFDSQEEFEKNKQELTRQCQEAINGLQVRTGASTSIGGVCIIWGDYAEHLEGLISAFRRDLESLSGEIGRIPYDVGKKLKKLKIEEKNLKRTIEENLKRANLEKDPQKKRKLLILVDEDRKKLQTNYEEQKKIRIGEDFDPDKSIEEFIKGIEDKLAGRNKPRNPSGNKNFPDPWFPPNPNHQEPGPHSSKPLDPFQSTSRTTPSNFFQSNLKLIILGTFALLVLFYLYSNQSKPEPYYDF